MKSLRNTMRRILSAWLSTIAVMPLSSFGQERSGTLQGIEGSRQILPRGRIASIDNPTFVSAAAATIPPGAWVLGFEIGGQSYAYDLNLFNAHEVVNHETNEGPVAAVW